MLRPDVASSQARNGGRMGLRRFDDTLQPSLDEIGIDLIRLKIFGRWQARGSFTEGLRRFEDYLEYIATEGLTGGRCFERVGRNGSRSFLTLRSEAPLTLRGKFTFVRDHQANHNLFVKLDANPTRTLEHLLLRFGALDDFEMAVARLHPVEFFESHPNPRLGAGRSDNFISHVALARLRGERDVFGWFLPCYVRQLQGWVEHTLLWSEFEHAVERNNGATAIAIDGFSVRLDWQRTTFPIVEVYFERRHPEARLLTERLARSALGGLNSVHIRRYADESRQDDDFDDVEEVMAVASTPNHVRRHGHQLAVSGSTADVAPLSVSGSLTDNRRYTIYAKEDDRLRLELKYEGLPLLEAQGSRSDPAVLMTDRLEAARRSSLTDMRWANVAALCSPLPDTGPDALADLVAAIMAVMACDHGDPVSSTLRTLLTTGGIVEDDTLVPRSMLDRLARREVLEYRPFRRRERQGTPRRYVLAPRFRALRERLMDDRAER